MARDSGPTTSVYILARYNDLRPDRLSAWQSQFRGALTIEFLTCHRAKGQEADYVFVLGCDSGSRGFPAERQDDSLLGLVMPQAESFPHAEERRLLYVALTRARHETWLFADRQQPSRFVLELVDQVYASRVIVESADEGAITVCPACSMGVLELRKGRYGAFWGCSTYPACRYTVRISVDRRPESASGVSSGSWD